MASHKYLAWDDHFGRYWVQTEGAHYFWKSMVDHGEVVGDPLAFDTMDEAIVWAREELAWKSGHPGIKPPVLRVVRVDQSESGSSIRTLVQVWPEEGRSIVRLVSPEEE